MEEKNIAINKIVHHEYFVEEKYEAGIVLEGAEVKSLRNGAVNLKDSFCMVQNGELFVKNMHITVYNKAGAFNSKDAKRDRKLLIHKIELVKIRSKVEQKGLTLIPIRLYFKGSLIKMELGLCRGKHTFDKKQALKEKDVKREAERLIKNY